MKTNLTAIVAASAALVSAGLSAQSNAPGVAVPAAGFDAANFGKGTVVAKAAATNRVPDAKPTSRAKVPTARVQTTNAPVPAPATPYEAGQAEARRDLRLGLLRLKGYGLASRPSKRYTEGSQTPVEVPVQTVAGCVVTEDLIQHVRGYNEVMEAEIQRQIRNGTLKRAVRAANATNAQTGGPVLLPGWSATIRAHSNQSPR
jgi:hypothetical protein